MESGWKDYYYRQIVVAILNKIIDKMFQVHIMQSWNVMFYIKYGVDRGIFMCYRLNTTLCRFLFAQILFLMNIKYFFHTILHYVCSFSCMYVHYATYNLVTIISTTTLSPMYMEYKMSLSIFYGFYYFCGYRYLLSVYIVFEIVGGSQCNILASDIVCVYYVNDSSYIFQSG